jgi:hypothetical protein
MLLIRKADESVSDGRHPTSAGQLCLTCPRTFARRPYIRHIEPAPAPGEAIKATGIKPEWLHTDRALSNECCYFSDGSCRNGSITATSTGSIHTVRSLRPSLPIAPRSLDKSM